MSRKWKAGESCWICELRERQREAAEAADRPLGPVPETLRIADRRSGKVTTFSIPRHLRGTARAQRRGRGRRARI